MSDRRGPWTIRAGMLAYDALSFDKREERHHMLDPEQTPGERAGDRDPRTEGRGGDLRRPGRVRGTAGARDALDALDHGAAVLTDRRVRSLLGDGRRVHGVVLDNGEEVKGAVTVNVAGPWVDEVLGRGKLSRRLIGGTKGTPLIVGNFEGAPREALYVEAQDGRPYFIVPWSELYLIGTTHSRYEGDLDHVVADDDEIEYLISATKDVIPGARLRNEDVIYSYAGVRPLPEAHGSEDLSPAATSSTTTRRSSRG